ncbi:MAG TPA: biotin transporter BioY [Bacteroidetes bacterium]|nr:biotin transporter BioY [Bacteroidota bacterium]HIL57921.1 biotin transporter BioY [Rhodothermales bacterium]
MSVLTLSADRPSILDALRGPRATTAAQVMGIVGFAALAALGAQTRIYLWEVPLSFSTLAVYGAGLFLGGRNGALSMLLYLAAGLVFPVFSGDAYGPSYFLGATAGYLFSYPLVALLVGSLTDRWTSLIGSGLAMMVGAVLLYTMGVTWLAVAGPYDTLGEAVVRGALLFLPFGLVKMWLLAGAHAGLRRVSAN